MLENTSQKSAIDAGVLIAAEKRMYRKGLQENKMAAQLTPLEKILDDIASMEIAAGPATAAPERPRLHGYADTAGVWERLAESSTLDSGYSLANINVPPFTAELHLGRSGICMRAACVYSWMRLKTESTVPPRGLFASSAAVTIGEILAPNLPVRLCLYGQAARTKVLTVISAGIPLALDICPNLPTAWPSIMTRLMPRRHLGPAPAEAAAVAGPRPLLPHTEVIEDLTIVEAVSLLVAISAISNFEVTNVGLTLMSHTVVALLKTGSVTPNKARKISEALTAAMGGPNARIDIQEDLIISISQKFSRYVDDLVVAQLCGDWVAWIPETFLVLRNLVTQTMWHGMSSLCLITSTLTAYPVSAWIKCNVVNVMLHFV